MSTHMANQVNQYKSTSSLIPPIREVEDECWTQGFLADSPDTRRLFQRKTGEGEGEGDHLRKSDDDSDVGDRHTFPSLVLLISGRTGTPKTGRNSYVYTFNVTSMLLDFV